MTQASYPSVLCHIQQKLQPSLFRGISDAQLLERFLQDRDEASFELLTWRHGAMVYGVCQRILRHAQDAEDAFQATFLTLARKASSIGKRESVGGWLYMVAFRIALRAKAQRTHRTRQERPLEDLPIDGRSVDPVDAAAWRELSRLLDSELSRIPEKYRTAFILCHLEGKTCEEAAEHLGCPRGTIQSRVGRARERLQARLTRRGWVPASLPLCNLLDKHASTLTQVAPVLIQATVHSAILTALGKTLAGLVPRAVLDLVDDTVRALYWRKLLYLSFLAFLALGGSALTWWTLSSGQSNSVGTACGCHDTPKP